MLYQFYLGATVTPRYLYHKASCYIYQVVRAVIGVILRLAQQKHANNKALLVFYALFNRYTCCLLGALQKIGHNCVFLSFFALKVILVISIKYANC